MLIYAKLHAKEFSLKICANHEVFLKASIVFENGSPFFDIDGIIYSPLLFRSNRPEDRNISEFYKAGVRLMSILCTGLDCTLDVPYNKFGENWLGRKKYDFSTIDRQINLFLRHAPDIYLNVMLQLDTRNWYLAENPECSSSYWNLVEMAGYEKWRLDTLEYLTDIVEYIEEKYQDRVFAYSLICGTSMEWYTNSQGNGRAAAELRYHPIKEQVFRQFIGNQQVDLPVLNTLMHTTNGVFRHPQNDRAALDYWKFHHEIIGETIVYFAEKLKQLVQHKKLTGLFYGYLMELTGRRLLHEGQLGYEKVWQCPDLDMIYAPASYQELRTFLGTSGFLNTVDSVKIHGKMQYHEVDHTTFIAPQTVENGRSIPGHEAKLQNEFESCMVIKREFVMSEAKRVGMWWFDFFGGYYYSKGLMETVQEIVKAKKILAKVPMASISQVAVFGDVGSMLYVSENSTIAQDTVRNMRGNLNRLGAPYDLFTLSDLDHPNMKHHQYKLYIFLNAFNLSKDTRTFIQKNLEANGKTILWLYAPGYIQEDGFDVRGIVEVTGIQVKETQMDNETIIVESAHVLSGLRQTIHYGFSMPITPMFTVDDPDAIVLGHFKSGYPGLACKVFNTYTSYYSATGNIPVEILREIARNAGVHIFQEGNNPVYINSRILGIHVQEGNSTHLKLPHEVDVVSIFDGIEAHSKNQELDVSVIPGTVQLFLLKRPLKLA